MISRSGYRHRLQFFALGVLLIFISGLSGARAQVAAPSPSRAQVIAQSVESVSGGAMKWYFQTESIAPAGQPPFAAANEFIYAETGQVLVTQASGQLELLSPGQATYASPEKKVNAVGQVPEDVLTFSLISASAPDGSIAAHPFDVAQGTYNLQLTRGVLLAGDKDTFYPASELPFLFIVLTGAVSVQEVGTTELEYVGEGDVWEWTHTTDIYAEEDATYAIVSIGERVNVPTPAARAVGPRAPCRCCFKIAHRQY